MFVFWIFFLIVLLGLSARIWHNLSSQVTGQRPLEVAARHYVRGEMSRDEYAMLMDAFRSRYM